MSPPCHRLLHAPATAAAIPSTVLRDLPVVVLRSRPIWPPAVGALPWAQLARANAIDSAAIHPWNLSTQTRSLNHLISAGEDGGREGQAKALCSRDVHHQLDTPGLLDWKITRRGPL